MVKKLKVNSRIMSKWQTGKDGYPRIGFLPEGWDGKGTVLIQWDDDGSWEWDDRTSFIYIPELRDALKLI